MVRERRAEVFLEPVRVAQLNSEVRRVQRRVALAAQVLVEVHRGAHRRELQGRKLSAALRRAQVVRRFAVDRRGSVVSALRVRVE